MVHDDDYLFDRQGHDPLVEKLERSLAPLAWQGKPFVPPQRTRWWLPALATAASIAALWFLLSRQPKSAGPSLVIVGGERLALEQWVNADQDLDLDLGQGTGRITLRAGSRLQVRQLEADASKLYLAVGSIEAFVRPDAKPRFFQVQTPSTQCVDLGCKYELVVEPDGSSRVDVVLGKVQFEHDGRELYVPYGATCRVDAKTKRGTPRFRLSRLYFQAALDAYDEATAADVLAAASLVCERAQEAQDTLSLWHLLQETDPQLRDLALAALVRIAGEPENPRDWRGLAPGPLRELWRTHLQAHW